MLRRPRTLGLAIALAWSVLPALAQELTPLSDALGGATVASTRTWGGGENPAAGPVREGFSARVYGHTLSGGVGLSRVSIDAAFRAKLGVLQVHVQQFSPPGYSLTGAHVSASRRLADGLSLGVRAGVVRGDFDEYGTSLDAVAQAGVLYRVSKSLRAGAHYVYTDAPRLPLAEHALRVGVVYTSSPRVQVLAGARQAVGQRLAGQLGLRFEASDRLTFAAGIRTGGLTYSLGVDAGLTEHVRLQLTAVAYQDLPLGVSYGAAWE